jgi:hypothetical protein
LQIKILLQLLQPITPNHFNPKVMTINFKLIVFGACLLVSVSSCKNNAETPTPSVTTASKIIPPPPSNVIYPTITTTPTPENVFVAGLESNGVGPLQAKFCKNGVAFNIGTASSATMGACIFVK